MLGELIRWSTRRYRRDLMLGVGLVVLYAVSVAATADTLEPEVVGNVGAVQVVGITLALIAIATTAGLWKARPHRELLVIYPLLVAAGSVCLASFTEGVASTYSGFFALAMIYAGLVLRRALVAAMMAATVVCWLVSQDAMVTIMWVRFGVLLVVWSTCGFALATHAGRDRAETVDWVTRANEDALTGLRTKRALVDWIDGAIRSGRQEGLHLMLIDLDGFKNVNDLYGHAAGDEVLIETSRRMLRSLRPADVVARLGGDEFAVVLVDTDAATARLVAEHLLAELAEPVELAQGYMAVTASIGLTDVATIRTADQGLAEADLAMYDAKRTGKNQVAGYCRDLVRQRDAPGRRELELLDALERGELELYYQPVVHLLTDRVIGVEALVRWNHPELGLLTPIQFLSAIESTRSAVALSEWVLRSACAQTMDWQPHDPGEVLTVAVNVSAREMLAAGFVERLVAILNEIGLPPSLLVLEVTEGLVLSDAPLIRERIDLLRRIGVRIAIDDFGTGRSSLAELRDLPADIVKIAPTFTQALDGQTNASSMIKAIAAIASALALDVVVEGVETEHQRRCLAELGCHLAQGFHLGRPQPARALHDLDHRHRPRPVPTEL